MDDRKTIPSREAERMLDTLFSAVNGIERTVDDIVFWTCNYDEENGTKMTTDLAKAVELIRNVRCELHDNYYDVHTEKGEPK